MTNKAFLLINLFLLHYLKNRLVFVKKWSFLKIVMVIFVLLSFPGDTAIYLPILSFEKFVVYDSNNEVINEC